MTAASAPPPLNADAGINTTRFVRDARTMLNAVREVTDYARKHGTITLTAKLSGTNTFRPQLAAALKAQPLAVGVTFDQATVQAAVTALKTQLGGVVGINTSTLTAVQAQINTQIGQLTALIAQLRALGGAGGAGGSGPRGQSYSAATKALLVDLEKLNNEYKRGEVSSTQYAARLQALNASLKTVAAGVMAGSAEFRALDRAITGTVQGLRNIQTGAVTKLRTELADARQKFDAAAAAAQNLGQKRAAIAAYSQDINRIRVSLQGLASSGQLTAQQLGNVNRMLAQTAREANTIKGGVNIAGLSGNIQNALGNLTQMNPLLAQFAGNMQALPIGLTAAVAGIAAFTAGIAASFRTAAQFQQVMVDIRALTQPTAQGFEDLSDAAKQLGGDLGVGPRDTAAAILELNRAGLTATDTINGGLVGALNLAGAAGIASAQASNLAAAAMTAFKLSAQDMPAIADTFANFSNKTFLGAEDLSQAIAAVGPVARSAGLDLNTFSGYMATLAQGGFKQMSDAGTSLKTMLLSLQAPSETAAGAIEELGLNVYDAQGDMLPLADILEQLRTRLAGLTEQQKNAALKDIFGTDGIRAATILLGESRDAIDENIKAMGLQGEAARVAKERMDSYQGAMRQLTASWETFKIEVGEKFLPVMTDVVKGITGGVKVLGEFANGTRNLIPYLAPFLGAFIALRGAVIAAAAPALWATLLTAIGGFFTTVNAWVASNPLGAIALAVSALAATVNKIMQDTARIYDQIDQANQDSFNKLMERVRALQAEGTELGRVQAKYLLALQQLQAAREGTISGTNMWGERTYIVDPEAVKKAEERVNALRQEMIAVRTEAQRHGGLKTEVGGPQLAPEQLKKREDAIRALRKGLEERAFTIRLEGMSDVDAAVAQSRREFEKLREEVKKPFVGDPKNPELLRQLASITRQAANEERLIRANFRAEEAKKDEEFARKGAESAAQFARDARRAEVSAWAEGQEKKQAQRELELQDVQANVAKLVQEYGKVPGLREQIELAGRARMVALQQSWAREDVQEAQERAVKIADALRTAQEAQATAIVAARTREVAEFELSLARRIDAVRGNALATAQIEADAVQVRARYAQRAAEQQYVQDVSRLQETRRRALDVEGLSAQERTAIHQTYLSGLATLDADYQTDYLKRVQEREREERDAAEKIRQARVQAALRPAEEAGRDADRTRAMQGLVDSSAEKLALERQVQASLEQQAAVYTTALAQAGTLRLTEQERQDLLDRIQGANLDIARSQREQASYQREITGEAREIVTLFGQVQRLMTGSTGLAVMQQEYGDATTDVADAYARAVPYLRDFRTQSLKPEEYTNAKNALQGLITALDAQRQKLEVLRGEYERQRDSLGRLQDQLRGFGQEFGDKGLLDNAISFNQGTYDQARRALEILLQGGTYDAAQLADATGKLQTSYTGLKDSVLALGEAQAKEHEAQMERVRKEGEARLKELDRQITAAKAAGLDTTALERQRTDAQAALEKEVEVLEGKAEAARTAARKALEERTGGLQQLLTGVSIGAKKAQGGLDALGSTVRVAEKEVQDSAARMKTALTGTFQNLPAVAAQAGRDAGRQFMLALQGQLSAARVPITAALGSRTSPVTTGGNTIVNLYYNGQKMPDSQDLRQLARDLTPLIKGEAQRLNPGGPCTGAG